MTTEPRDALSDPDPAIRLQAARKVCRLARGDWTAARKRWAHETRTTRALLDALTDPDPRVREQCAVALGANVQRFDVQDRRIHDTLCRMHPTEPDRVQLAICQAVPSFGTEEAWQVVRASLACRPRRKASWAVGLAVGRFGTSIPESSRREWSEVLLERCYTEKNGDSISAMVCGIDTLACPEVMERLEHLAEHHDNKVLTDEIEYKVEQFRARAQAEEG